jgi:hypothetical protein
MRVSDEKWNEIVNEVKAGIARWNAKASEHKTGDTFHPVLKENGLMGGFTTLSTFHDHAARMIAREPATGEVRKIKFIWREGRIAGAAINPKDPKSWATSLAEKPASEIVEQLKLLDFFMPISASHIGTQTAQQEAS